MNTLLLISFLACSEKENDSSDLIEDSATTTDPSEDSGDVTDPEDSGDTTDPEDSGDSEPSGDAAIGEAIVTQKCMVCHGGNPAIENSANMTDEALVNLFQNGQGYMPSVDLDAQETLDVIAYLRLTYGSGE